MTLPEDARQWKKALLHPWTLLILGVALGVPTSVVTTLVLNDGRAVVGEPFVLGGWEYTLITLACERRPTSDSRDQLCRGSLAIVNQTQDEDPPPDVELKLVSGGDQRFSPTEATVARLGRTIEPGSSAVIEVVFSPPGGLTFHGLDVISTDGSKTVKLFAGEETGGASSSCVRPGAAPTT